MGSQVDPLGVTESKYLKKYIHQLALQASIHVPQMDQYQRLPFSYPFIKNDEL